MAKQRMINTKFWSDSWIRQKLNPLDRYLFLYLLTNERTNICGIYELPIEIIAFETGIDKEDLNKSYFPRLEPKVIYRKNWVIIPNFIKHQNQKSPTVQKGIEEELKKIPDEIKEILEGIDTLSHLNLNLNLNLNSNLNTNTKRESGSNEPTPFQEAKNFFSQSQSELLEWAVSYAEKKNLEPQTISEYALQFFSYWTERNKSGKKQKWELEKTFEITRRWASWLSNQAKWSKKGHINKQTPNFIL